MKGTAINRAILVNLMKSKCNETVFDSCYSHTNCSPNEILADAIKQQIPKGIRDIIGHEEALRMSNIYTGGNVKSINYL